LICAMPLTSIGVPFVIKMISKHTIDRVHRDGPILISRLRRQAFNDAINERQVLFTQG
jgi:hypothetical protein